MSLAVVRIEQGAPASAHADRIWVDGREMGHVEAYRVEATAGDVRRLVVTLLVGDLVIERAPEVARARP